MNQENQENCRIVSETRSKILRLLEEKPIERRELYNSVGGGDPENSKFIETVDSLQSLIYDKSVAKAVGKHGKTFYYLKSQEEELIEKGILSQEARTPPFLGHAAIDRPLDGLIS